MEEMLTVTMRREREKCPTSISWTHHPYNSPQPFTVPLPGVNTEIQGGDEGRGCRDGKGQVIQTFWGPLKDSVFTLTFSSVRFSSIAQSCLTLCNPMDCSTPGFPVHHQLRELAQTHVRQVGDAIQPSHPLSSPSPPAFNLSQHHGLLQGVSSSHQMAKVLEFQLQHQSFHWIFRTDFL